MEKMFHDASAFNQPLDHWNIDNVTNMVKMFSDATSFNQSLDKWNIKSAIDMMDMFQGASFKLFICFNIQ
jgi:surface protein